MSGQSAADVRHTSAISHTLAKTHWGYVLTVANARRYQVQHRLGLSPNVTKEILMARCIRERLTLRHTRVLYSHSLFSN